MPKPGYVSTGKGSLPEIYIKAIDMLREDPDYVKELRAEGVVGKISRSLVIRKALLSYLKDKGFDIDRVSEAQGK